MELDVEVNVVLLYTLVALVLGAVNGFMKPEPLLGLFIAVIFFYFTYRMVPRVMDVEDSSFEYSATNTLKKGAIPFWFLWLVSWTLVETLTGIPV